MKIAVLSLTRDRLPYTQHCFQTLADNAGCDYDHFVLDQGSEDGTQDWLCDEYQPNQVVLSGENVGISVGLNVLLDEALNPADYDVIVKFDNDCELLTKNALADIADLTLRHQALLSPRIHGLRFPPPTVGRFEHENDPTIDITNVIGGIYLSAPASLYADGYRHDERNPPWGGDDTALCRHWKNYGGLVGYVNGYDANHYLTTNGQVADIPHYFERRVREGGLPR